MSQKSSSKLDREIPTYAPTVPSSLGTNIWIAEEHGAAERTEHTVKVAVTSTTNTDAAVTSFMNADAAVPITDDVGLFTTPRTTGRRITRILGTTTRSTTWKVEKMPLSEPATENGAHEVHHPTPTATAEYPKRRRGDSPGANEQPDNQANFETTMRSLHARIRALEQQLEQQQMICDNHTQHVADKVEACLKNAENEPSDTLNDVVTEMDACQGTNAELTKRI
ncbi:uncharacterized protein EKO05_0001813 [Ascochyta rabiei]|nr:uncharacterized protein EKO05_0001813 [Ascochyta rabiei]UPX11193.1 hypothetical protein EKO05_0001813 [Ascochyta rabiei]